MVAQTRQKRRDRQAEHIPSPKAFSKEENKWIDNPELIKEDKEAPESEEKA